MYSQVNELQQLVEKMVAESLDKYINQAQMKTLMTNPNARNPLMDRNIFRSFDQPDGGAAGQFFQGIGQFGQLGRLVSQLDSLKKPGVINLAGETNLKAYKRQIGGAWGGMMGLAGMYNAYKTGDALGGAMSGMNAFVGFGLDPVIGAVVGLLAGLFSPGIDRWERPKFKDADKAYDKLFTMDRGERNDYYLPESYYFRTGWKGNRKLVIRIGNEKIDGYIRDSLTNDYASQLQRGLVF